MTDRVKDWHEGIEPLKAIYVAHCAGCCLHVVADDGNVEQDTMDWTLNYAREQGHPACIAAAELLARMTQTQRAKLYKHYDDYAGSVSERFPFLVR